MRRGPLSRWRVTATLAVAIALAVPAIAAAVGISLDRAPAPPQAIQRGVGTEQVTFSITYQTVADAWQLRFSDPAGTVLQSETQSVAGQPSPINASRSFQPPPNAAVGRYRATVDFFSTPGGLESSALVTFDVADQLGTLQLVKFEDVNGNGSRDPGEPGVPGWTFRLVNPAGGGSIATTGADGSITIGSVPAGVWRVEEVIDPAWVAITPAAGQVTVPAGGVGAFVAGNARPAPLSGVVYIDANRNGVRVDLTGTRPGGITVSTRTVLSGADGSYSFPGLLPGTYTVSIAVPGGLTATSPRSLPGRVITSGTGNPNNNFGLAGPGGATAQGGPTPNIAIRKAGPSRARANRAFTYRIVVRNRSEFPATNVEVTDLVPASLTLVRIPSGATIRNGVVTWRLGTMAPGAVRRLAMRVRVNPNVTGRIRNTATVTADNLPPRRSTVTTRVVGPRPVARSGGVTG